MSSSAQVRESRHPTLACPSGSCCSTSAVRHDPLVTSPKCLSYLSWALERVHSTTHTSPSSILGLPRPKLNPLLCRSFERFGDGLREMNARFLRVFSQLALWSLVFCQHCHGSTLPFSTQNTRALLSQQYFTMPRLLLPVRKKFVIAGYKPSAPRGIVHRTL